MEKIKVSVVIPVYNSENTIKKCVESVLRQTLHEIEVICVNDGSTDGTADILNELAECDDRIHVLHQNNAGVSTARNNGLFRAKGEYVAFIDSDDYVKAEMYERLYRAAAESSADVVCCNSFRVVGDKTYLSGGGHIYGDSVVAGHNQISQLIISPLLFGDGNTAALSGPWNKLYRRQLVRLHSIAFNTGRTHGEDWIFNLQIFNKAEIVRFINDALYYYVFRPGSLVSRFHHQWVKSMEEGHQMFADEFPQFDYEGMRYANGIMATSRLYIVSVCSKFNTLKEWKMYLEPLWKSSVYQKYRRIYRDNTSFFQFIRDEVNVLMAIAKTRAHYLIRKH